MTLPRTRRVVLFAALGPPLRDDEGEGSRKVSAYVQFPEHIPSAQRDFLERVINEHFRHSLGAVEVVIQHSAKAQPGSGYQVAKAKKWVFKAKAYPSKQPAALQAPYFEGDVSDEVRGLLERYRPDLVRLDEAVPALEA